MHSRLKSRSCENYLSIKVHENWAKVTGLFLRSVVYLADVSVSYQGSESHLESPEIITGPGLIHSLNPSLLHHPLPR
ncbi:hypothetical protein DNTS_011802 [Danionella cerebrum]|uniref:Uncharacterized protein n=1 Tax=Danionella cerebrum TaxID=2873325 RepID=A0A553P5G8_9TELE|nr:hypothetical protein DNTS_011802 [Danionella translucida]